MKTIPVQTIQFTKAKLERFQSAYNLALKMGDETFDFEGQTFLPAYAKYVIEYVEAQLAQPDENQALKHWQAWHKPGQTGDWRLPE